MPRKELRWKGKDGEFLPEVGREDERDMRVEVVHYSDLEQAALEACAQVEADALPSRFFLANGGTTVLVGRDYREGRLPFSIALELCRHGYSIMRDGWNGNGLRVRAQFPDEHSKMTKSYLYLEYPSDQRVPWAPSQTDVLAEDWRVL